MLLLEIITFCFAFWLGLFLARRAAGGPALGWAAGGLISYACALALNSLGQWAEENLATLLQRQVPLLLAPLLCWLGVIWQLRDQFGKLPRLGGSEAEVPRKTGIGLILIATIAFMLGVGLIFLPAPWVPRRLMFLGISIDLLVLGFAVAFLDAFDQGERFWPDFWRSLCEAEIVATLFGLQVGFIIWRVTGPTFPMLVLLYLILATAIALQAFGLELQAVLDRLLFRNSPRLRTERAALRELTAALPREKREDADWTPEEFIKLTRKALSQLSNIPKLAANPLIYMPLIEQQVVAQHVDDNRLARATVLRALLVNSIEKLKPNESEPFGTAKGWRHYNALYFPYVRGLKPYGRQMISEGLSGTERKALNWFIQEVPARTLYNWQTAAAKVVALDLLEQNR